MKNAVFWDVAPCRACVNRSFGVTYRLHLQDGDTFLRNVSSHKIYTAPHPRRRHSSRLDSRQEEDFFSTASRSSLGSAQPSTQRIPVGGARYRSWMRHYATSRKVAGSIPNEVIGLFNWPNPSSLSMALWSTQPLTEMSIRNPPGVKGRPARKADNLTAICESIIWRKSGTLDVSERYGPSRLVTGIPLP
jgi:hypothetical protein